MIVRNSTREVSKLSTESAYVRLLAADQSRGSTYVNEGWLPPEAECPELADLRTEHLRLLGVVHETHAKLAELRREQKSAEDRRAAAVREAILAGKDPAKVKVAVPDEVAVARADRDCESACEALEIFVRRALAEIEQTAPTIEANIANRLSAAEAKRLEARRLLAEADRLAADPKRLLNWLDRYVTVNASDDAHIDGILVRGETRKRSVLGPIAFTDTDVPLSVPVPDVFNEIAGLGPAQVAEVGEDHLLPEEEEAISATH